MTGVLPMDTPHLIQESLQSAVADGECEHKGVLEEGTFETWTSVADDAAQADEYVPVSPAASIGHGGAAGAEEVGG